MATGEFKTQVNQLGQVLITSTQNNKLLDFCKNLSGSAYVAIGIDC